MNKNLKSIMILTLYLSGYVFFVVPSKSQDLKLVSDSYSDPFYKPTPTPSPSLGLQNNPFNKSDKKKQFNNQKNNKPYIDPFNNKPQTSPYIDPFNGNNKPINNDPFSNGTNTTGDPFSKPDIDSGAYLEIKKLDGMNSYQSAPILAKIASRKNLSSREQNLVISYSEKMYLEGKVDVLKALLSNWYLSETARNNLLSLLKRDNTFYSKNKTDLLISFTIQVYLSAVSQKNIIDVTFQSLEGEGNKETVLSSLVTNKYLKSGAKAYLISEVGRNFSFEDKKVNILTSLVMEQKLSYNEQKTFISTVQNNFLDENNKRILFNALIDNQNLNYDLKNYINNLK